MTDRLGVEYHIDEFRQEEEEKFYSDCCNALASSRTPDGSIRCKKCSKECNVIDQDEIQEDTTSMEEKLEELSNLTITKKL